MGKNLLKWAGGFILFGKSPEPPNWMEHFVASSWRRAEWSAFSVT
jgi:hypothetical protein